MDKFCKWKHRGSNSSTFS